jgi:hypothetical protein
MGGGVLQDELRGAGRERLGDPGIGARLRERIESGARVAGFETTGEPVEVRKSDLAAPGGCVGQMLATRWMPEEPDRAELVLGRLADAMATLALVAGALDVPKPSELRALLELSAAETERLGLTDETLVAAARRALEHLGEAFELVAGLGLPPGYLCRTEQTLRVRLLDGRLVLAGRADVVLGGGGEPAVSTAIVELKAGRVRTEEHLAEAAFYALAETLRSGVAPRAIAVAYLGPEGSWASRPVDEALLDSVADEVASVAAMLQRATAARVLTLSPSAEGCGLCRARRRCAAAIVERPAG